MRRRSHYLPISDGEAALLVSPAGYVHHPCARRESVPKQPRQQERAEVIDPQLLILAIWPWWDTYHTCTRHRQSELYINRCEVVGALTHASWSSKFADNQNLPRRRVRTPSCRTSFPGQVFDKYFATMCSFLHV